MSIWKSIAGMIDHAVLHPTADDEDLREACKLADKYQTASVCVKPYHVALASEILSHSKIPVCAVIGFPHGNNSTDIKVAETIEVIAHGAREVDMVINVGKALQGDWNYVRKEIQQINEACTSRNVILKVIFENDYIKEDQIKIKLCKICTEAGVAFVKTSTGFGFVKGSDGKYSYEGATMHDLHLMLENIGRNVSVKASGGVKNIDDALAIKSLGVKRIGTSSTEKLVEQAKERFGE